MCPWRVNNREDSGDPFFQRGKSCGIMIDRPSFSFRKCCGLGRGYCGRCERASVQREKKHVRSPHPGESGLDGASARWESERCQPSLFGVDETLG